MTNNMYAQRTNALRLGIRLELLTVGWMVIECALAIGAGLLAHSVLLTVFGMDSIIELISGLILLWRLSSEARGGDTERVERIEQRATMASAILLAMLCLYLVFSIAAGLLGRLEPERSLPGLVVALAAVVAMPLLAAGKRRANRQLNSAALRADIAESVGCAYMAATVMVGLAANALFGAWWIEYLAGIILLYWLARETYEAWQARNGEDEESDQ